MGNGPSSRESPEYVAASRAFTQEELEKMKKLFISLASQSRSEGKYVCASVFQAYLGIRGSLGTRLFDLVTQHRKDHCLYFDDLVIAKATYEKGSPSEMAEFMFQLLDLTGGGKAQKTEVESVLLSILTTVLDLKDHEAETRENLLEESLQAFLNAPEYSVNKEEEEDFLSAAEYSMNTEGEKEPCMTMQDFKKLCSVIPSLKRFLATLLSPLQAGKIDCHIPTLIVPEDFKGGPLLRQEHAWHISGILKQEEAQEWVLLYHSSINGLSFNTFLGNVVGVGGPTVLVVKDKEGCIYGGYASQPWEKHCDFYGDMKSFLFTLHPKVSLYRPTGQNKNLQWCAFNYISESIPNGIGFGGQINHWGLFISGNFDRGHTRYSVTFGNPSLSTKEDIVPHIIECWGIVVKGIDEPPDASKLKGTILERFKEDRQMLNMVGIANASESIGPD